MTGLDDRLREFLDNAASERDEGVTLRSVAGAQKRLTDAFTAHEEKCDLRWDAYGKEAKSFRVRTETLEGKVRDIEHQEEDTGSHMIALDGKVMKVAELAARRASLPPVLRAVNWVGTRAATV